MTQFVNCIMYGLVARVHATCVGNQCHHPEANAPSMLQKVTHHAHTVATSGVTQCALDVILVMDYSGSIGQSNSVIMNNAAQNFAQGLAAYRGSRLAVITYSTKVQWHSASNALGSRLSEDLAAVKGKIAAIKYDDASLPAQLTNLQLALKEAGDEMRARVNADEQKEGSSSSSGGGKNGVVRNHPVVLVFTDGVPTITNPDGSGRDIDDHKENARNQARYVKESPSDLTMVAIGNIDRAYMESLVTTPITENYFPIEEFNRLSDQFISNLVSRLCGRAGCQKDTRATCSILNNLCFQNTRGATECSDQTKTCHCTEQDECVFFPVILGTRNSSWGVCRKTLADGVTQDPQDVRGENNLIVWLFKIVLDIFSAYAQSSSR